MTRRNNFVLLGVLVVAMFAAEYVPLDTIFTRRVTTSASAAPQTKVIHFGEHGFSYEPAQTAINVGETVVWQGNFSTHVLVSDIWLWDAQFSGSEFRQTFTQPGTYHFYCQLHGGPQGVGMSGVIIVK